jgi:hypothetical protein
MNCRVEEINCHCIVAAITITIGIVTFTSFIRVSGCY